MSRGQEERHRGSRAVAWARSAGVALTLALVLSGCGSHYTKLDFVKRADGICLNTTRAVRLLSAPEFTGTAAQQRRSLSGYLARVAPLVTAEARRLTALPRPPGGAAERELLRRWIGAVRASAAGMEVLAAASRGGDAAAVSAAAAALTAVPVVTLASRYGAAACAGPGASYVPPARDLR